jgi:iron(III) transport system substrate-binding protein
MVDASRLFKAQNDKLFQPIQSAVLKQKIPAQYTASDNSWFGFSSRARVIIYNKTNVKASDVDAYEKLGDAVNKGKVCTRSGTHPYNLSLFGAMVERLGTDKTEAILKGMVNNMARKPVGGDTDQIKAVASGECGVTIANTYYWARLLRSTKPEDQAIVAKVAMVWPNQTSPYASGTHVNIAGGAVAKHAPHRAAAIQFLEYLASPSAQSYFAEGNNEWPIDPKAVINNPALKSLGTFKAETVPASAFGLRQVTAARLMNQVGYK